MGRKQRGELNLHRRARGWGTVAQRECGWDSTQGWTWMILAVWPWAVSLLVSLSFLLCYMGITAPPGKTDPAILGMSPGGPLLSKGRNWGWCWAGGVLCLGGSRAQEHKQTHRLHRSSPTIQLLVLKIAPPPPTLAFSQHPPRGAWGHTNGSELWAVGIQACCKSHMAAASKSLFWGSSLNLSAPPQSHWA